MQKNFVSISAITDKEQLEGIAKICNDEEISFPIAIGYQVSYKSINIGTFSPRQPRFIDLGDLDKKTKDYGFITAIHYYSKNNETIISDLEKIIGLGINHSTTLLQLNTLPLPLEILGIVKNMDFKIIFKVAVSDKKTSERGYAVWKGEEVEDVSDGQSESLVNQVYDRRNYIDYAMFDPSHGTNIDLDLNENSLAIKFGKDIVGIPELNKLGLVYAGGIKPGNVRNLTKSLNRFFPYRFSIDSESGVRTDDKLDLGLIRDYLRGYKEEIVH
jgi:hypothetical protein